MEIRLTKGDSVAIPEGCVATIQNGCVVFEPQPVEFNDGDILVVKGYDGRNCPFIYAGDDEEGYHKFYVGINVCGKIQRGGGGARWGNYPLGRATESEVQRLFEQLGEADLFWNAEEKRLENIRWRAGYDEWYYFVDNLLKVGKKPEAGWEDDECYKLGNYFRTEKQAQAAADAIREVFKQIHEETTKN